MFFFFFQNGNILVFINIMASCSLQKIKFWLHQKQEESKGHLEHHCEEDTVYFYGIYTREHRTNSCVILNFNLDHP